MSDTTTTTTTVDGPPAPPAPAQPDPTPWADLVAALGALTEPVKGGKVNAGQRKYTYLTLADLLASVRPVLAAHGFAVMQDTWRDGDTVLCETTLQHTSGWARVSARPLTQRCGPGVQDLGSVITYLRRYQLGQMLGIAGMDDDDAIDVRPPKPASTAPADDLPPVDPETGEILSETPSRPRNTPGGAQTPKHKATRNQLGLIHGLLAKNGIDSNTDEGRTEGLALLASLARLDGPLTTSKDLTTGQASMVITELKALTEKADA